MSAASLKSFDPVSLGLPSDFVLTDYTRLKGCSCKLPQSKLVQLLQELSPPHHEQGAESASPPVSMMDCSIVPLHHKNEKGQPLFLVSTTDFFFPSVEDPFLQGQIGASNVLSDLYSLGITRCDNMLMLLAASTDMDELERTVTTREILKGFAERVQLAQTVVTGGQTVINPWPLIGGVAMSVVTASEMIPSPSLRLACPHSNGIPVPMSRGIRPGDVLVLTKPLGTQLAVNLQQWVRRPSPVYETKIRSHISEEEILQLYNDACAGMKRLNRTAAELMKTFHAHAATDVTGFGILGHAMNLAATASLNHEAEKEEVCLVFHTLPMYRSAVKASRLMEDKPYRLLEGFSAETSGGLLLALESKECAEAFCKEIEKREPGEAAKAWIVGDVIAKKSDEAARFDPHLTIVEV